METSRLDGPQTMDLPDLIPHVDATTLTALDAAPWRATAHVQAHAYIVRPTCPDLYDAMQHLIRAHGTRCSFRGQAYRYARVGQYKYWSIPPVLNREPLITQEGPPRC